LYRLSGIKLKALKPFWRATTSIVIDLQTEHLLLLQYWLSIDERLLQKRAHTQASAKDSRSNLNAMFTD